MPEERGRGGPAPSAGQGCPKRLTGPLPWEDSDNNACPNVRMVDGGRNSLENEEVTAATIRTSIRTMSEPSGQHGWPDGRRSGYGADHLAKDGATWPDRRRRTSRMPRGRIPRDTNLSGLPPLSSFRLCGLLL